jgi:UDP-GlcNAc:undecaprenyl-phosphate GlcNAc-1-phosphate transferase
VRSVIVAFALAMVITALLTPLVRRLALAAGAVDEPGARRVHARRVPRMGGIAIVLGFFLPLVVLLLLRTHAGLIFFSVGKTTVGLLLGSLCVVTIGLLDDLRGVGAKNKLLVQIAAAVIAFACGMRIDAVEIPFVGSFHLGWLSLPATVAWVVGIVNAINLIDGLDGLAAGVAFFACLTNFAIASLTGNVFILLVTASLGGALVGFLFHNFYPARIFMGDSGSMFLGFMLGAASLLGAATQKSPTLIAIIVPVLALGLPILDTLLAIARRFLARRSIFSADRGHIHHRLLDIGLTHRRAVLALYLLSITFTALALMVYFGRSWEIGAALFAVTALLAGVVRFVGSFNSSLVALGGTGADQSALTLRRSVPRVLRRLGDATSTDDLPILLEDFAHESGMLAIELAGTGSDSIERWRWESPDTQRRTVNEAVCVKFDIGEGIARRQLQFFFDSPAGAAGPQVQILLQLVADGAEMVLGGVPLPQSAAPRSIERIATPGPLVVQADGE